MQVTELPVRKWTQDYKEFLEALIKPEAATEAPLLLDFRDNSNEAEIKMTLQFASAAKAQARPCLGLSAMRRANFPIRTPTPICCDQASSFGTTLT